MAGLYLENMYNIEEYATLGNRIWKALKVGNIENVVELFNQALKPIPYDDFSKTKKKILKIAKQNEANIGIVHYL